MNEDLHIPFHWRLRAARSRSRVPSQLDRGRGALVDMHEAIQRAGEVAAGARRAAPSDTVKSVWAARRDATLDAPFKVGGYRLQWCENPPMRKIGLATDTVRLSHTGWCTNPDGDGDTVHGVVFQLSPRNRKPRFVPALNDPCNPDGDAAMLCLDHIVTADGSDPDRARYAAARVADQIAETYADEECRRVEIYRSGQDARKAACEALHAGKEWVGALRQIRNAFKARRARAAVGLTRDEQRDNMRHLIETARAAHCEYVGLRDTARDLRDIGTWARLHHADDFAEGYADGGRR